MLNSQLRPCYTLSDDVPLQIANGITPVEFAQSNDVDFDDIELTISLKLLAEVKPVYRSS